MKKTKTKLNKLETFMFQSIIKKSNNNNLPFTPREKNLLKWFAKFQLVTIITASTWIMPVIEINNHIKEFKELKSQVTIQSTHAQTTTATVQLARQDSDVKNPPKKSTNEKQLFTVLDQFTATVYAYNSLEGQTDSSPCQGAFGPVCGKKNIVANNCYLPGTIVEIMGEKYEVYDRMNSRYGCDVFDIFMDKDKEAALKWGKKITKVKILRVNK